MAESKSHPSNTISDKDVKAPNILERSKEKIKAVVHTKKSHHHHKESHGIRDDIDENTPISDVKAPNVFERVHEEIEALVQTIHPKKEAKSHDVHTKKSQHHHKESHGIRDDIDENTSISDVKAPNVFERVHEEFESLVQTIHPKKEAKSHANETETRNGNTKAESKPEKSASVSQEKDTKAPNLIERAKEEIEAIAHKSKSPHHHHKETHGTSDDIDENTSISKVKGPNVFERAKEDIEAFVQTIHPKKESDNVVPSPKKESGFGMSIGKWLEKVCAPWGHKRD
ncbi:Enolase-phosphatase [Actinidia chinensis var. chinensis]|uniref:Enolase-phosphatase n=1 Tax=Actinidia chinensis var. chinensis TaxID=1590841 RepID=A0A2R6Q545_ACTCC|nr:Enolase-phosphatase [Actinidia chinensis var. chinensis]